MVSARVRGEGICNRQPLSPSSTDTISLDENTSLLLRLVSTDSLQDEPKLQAVFEIGFIAA